METCFFEKDPTSSLAPRALAEGIGTCLLMLVAASSGLVAHRLLPDSSALALAASACGIAGSLIGLIVAFGSASGGHFNPLISGLQWLAGERKLSCAVAYIVAQLIGAIVGVLLAHAIFGMPEQIANPETPNWAFVVSELIASFGLMMIVFGCARSGRKDAGPFAVGAWLFAAIIATPSTSYANPAITCAALFADGPIRLGSSTAGLYLLAELAGALIAYLAFQTIYPQRDREATS
ncbi:aquaporin [Paraburkholderia sp. DHOC27]|uniref:aquaporin n=1 Tax=Paraburkholderia sp. DHOC27 TaxID=2303330 RepID=UPI0015F330E3|nr:aquaporin [Paraburkholderia sp. DHOC27]